MTVEEARAGRVQFPVGMRVLAVDDDPVCLRLLETLLLRCQYNVMTTDKATTALQLLRENKDRFDLVISDVHMPDMDGFKLLELVGLEMDLPVIMLSANGETQTVMKGITHGACDYLLKPVRIEELRNIWQHVIRRRKSEKRWNNDLESMKDGEKVQIAWSEDGQGKTDHSGKVNKKRKDQNEDDEDDSEDNMEESEDSSFQKKPRVVWSVELHRKFVAAVNQLGIDKAVPKKILDLMNVEGITRENVASHLQKYRLYLKRLSAVASQQASMAAAVGGRGSSYLHMASLNGLRSYQAMGGGQRQLPTLESLQMKGGVIGRMNSPSSLGMHSMLPSQTLHTTNSYDDLEKLQGINVPGYHQRNSHQGLPAASQLEQFQKPTLVQETRNHLLPGGFSGSTITANAQCSSSVPNVANISSLLQQNKQQHNRTGEVGGYSPFRMSSSQASSIGFQGVHQLPGRSRGDIRGNTSSISSHAATKVLGESPAMMAVAPHLDPRVNSHVANQPCSRIFNPASANIDNSIERWDYIFDSNEISSTSNSSLSNICIPDATANCQPSENVAFDQKLDVNPIGQIDFGVPLLSQNCMMDDKSTCDIQVNFTGGYAAQNSSLQTGINSAGCSLEDIVNSMIKPEQDDTAFIDADIECDIYSLGACM